jgi:hypothetical protein
MPPHSLLDKILLVLSSVRNDEEKLLRILSFLESEILPEIEEEDDDAIKLPEKYEEIVHGIADRISAGSVCYLNMDTMEVEDYPANIDEEEWEAVTGEKLRLEYLQWENVLTFEPLQSSDSFRIMEDFARQIDNSKVQNSLIDILNRRKPFAHFNSYIHNSKYREDWFRFRNNAYEKLVREMIYDKLNEAGE